MSTFWSREGQHIVVELFNKVNTYARTHLQCVYWPCYTRMHAYTMYVVALLQCSFMCVHVYVRACVRMLFLSSCMCVHVYVRACQCCGIIQPGEHICAHARTHMKLCNNTHTHARTYARTHARTSTIQQHAYARTHIRTHARTYNYSPR